MHSNIPICRWNGEDEQDLAESAYLAAVSRPLAGSVALAPSQSVYTRTASEWDGGITRTERIQWDPGSRLNTAYVRSCAEWAHANCKPGEKQDGIPAEKVVALAKLLPGNRTRQMETAADLLRSALSLESFHVNDRQHPENPSHTPEQPRCPAQTF